jgi:hypothetical protein
MIKETHHTSLMSEKILETIKKEGITPKPKWQFFIREWVVWGIVVLALFVGSIATALTIYIANASRFIEHQIIFSDIRYLFQIVPLLWILLFGIAVFYTVYALRETRRGYKWNPAWLVGTALALSVLIGSSTFASGIGEVIDMYLLTSVPFYKPLTNFQPKMWMDNDRGVIAGVVTEVSDTTFTVQKIDGALLEVTISEDTKILSPFGLHEGMRVRLVGTSTKQGGEEFECFEAMEVSPFKGRGGMMRFENPPSGPPPAPFPEMKEM